MRPIIKMSLKVTSVSVLILLALHLLNICSSSHQLSSADERNLLMSCNNSIKTIDSKISSNNLDKINGIFLDTTNNHNILNSASSIKQLVAHVTGADGKPIHTQDQEHNNNNNSNNTKNQSRRSFSSQILANIDRGIDMRAYHLDLHTYDGITRDAGQAAHLNNDNVEHVQRCSRDLDHFAHLLEEANSASLTSEDEINFNALSLSDAYGRPESDVMLGNTLWLGSYDQCNDWQGINQQDQKIIEAQYCLATTHSPQWKADKRARSVKIAVCLPRSCSNVMLEDHFMQQVDSMAHHHLNNGPYSKLKTTKIYCLPDASSKAQQMSWSAIGFVSVITMFLLIGAWASIVDYRAAQQSAPCNGDAKKCDDYDAPITKCSVRTAKTIIVEGFSVTRNVNKFFNVMPKPTTENNQQSPETDSHWLDCLTGLKSIGLIWIICSHSLLISPITDRNILAVDKITQTWLANVYLSGHLVVDTFFAISGILASYLLFKSAQLPRMTSRSWIGLTIHRYWRLTPLYLLCYWFTKSMGHLIGSGPYWDYATSADSPRIQCVRESWSEAIFHMSDFKSPKEHCMPFAWFIANGIKFWMVTPIFVTLIAHSVRAGYKFTLTVLAASMILVMLLSYNSNVDMVAVAQFKPESANNMLNNMSEVYVRPYSRIGAYLIGLLAGHILYSVETNQMIITLSTGANRLLWSLSTGLLFLLVFMMKFSGSLPMDNIRAIFSVCNAIIRPLFALITCWLVFALAQGQAKPLKRFLSLPIWKYLIRLSYSGYLVQSEVLANLFLTRKVAATNTYMDMILRSVSATFTTIVIAFIVTILVEYPLHAIEEIILPTDGKKSTNKNRASTVQPAINRVPVMDIQPNQPIEVKQC